ncbi:TPA: hypothetical protein RTH01_001589 [Campylobacter jejuni]|nr:hypothetical protein [Campylobacter jejuni]HDZ5084682.1 hypothetical protein [Campylobacter jejuni]HDZ5097810.1 hypothetical protein [Campylobacter jejuni]HDZ5101156.1 hypothetical protein [Campylobacter jejuni]HDZ5107730.1 hypothetical protein [Campylobacter jejuni]
MQIPIYSKLKAKLESKGIDSISSGQIAWFACSVCLALISFIISFFKSVYENDGNLFSAIFNLIDLNVFILIIYISIPFNLLYIYNAIPLVLSAIFIFLTFYFSSLNLFIVGCCGIGVFFLISIFKRKFMFSVLLFAVGYTCSLLLLSAIANYH